MYFIAIFLFISQNVLYFHHYLVIKNTNLYIFENKKYNLKKHLHFIFYLVLYHNDLISFIKGCAKCLKKLSYGIRLRKQKNH